jgi:hypothetical protein
MLRTDPRYRFLCLVLVTVPNMIYFAAYDPQAASSCQWIPVVADQTKAIIGHSNSARVAETFPLSLLHFEALCPLCVSCYLSFCVPEYLLFPGRLLLSSESSHAPLPAGTTSEVTHPLPLPVQNYALRFSCLTSSLANI